MAPPAVQRASFQEDCGSNAWSVVNRVSFDVKNHSHTTTASGISNAQELKCNNNNTKTVIKVKVYFEVLESSDIEKEAKIGKMPSE